MDHEDEVSSVGIDRTAPGETIASAAVTAIERSDDENIVEEIEIERVGGLSPAEKVHSNIDESLPNHSRLGGNGSKRLSIHEQGLLGGLGEGEGAAAGRDQAAEDPETSSDSEAGSHHALRSPHSSSTKANESFNRRWAEPSSR
jgi:hypothetical protein